MRKDGGAYGDPEEPEPWWARAMDAAARYPGARKASTVAILLLSALLWWAIMGAPRFW